MADDEKAVAPEEGEEGGKPNKKKLIIIGAAVAVLLLGGGGAFFMMGGDPPPPPPPSNTVEGEPEGEAQAPKEGEAAKDAPKTAADGKEEEKKEKEEEEKPGSDIKFGDTYSFRTFNLNLGNPLENHFVRFDVALEYGGGEAQKLEIEKRLPQLRDAVVSVASRKSREFLLGPDGKDQLRREILIRVNRYMSQPIEAVYITDMLIE